MNKGILKGLVYGSLITGGLALLDQICGNSSLSEMYNLVAHAAPNGSPISSTISLVADNFNRLSLPGAMAVGAGVATLGVSTYRGLENLVSDPKEKKQEA